MTDTKRVFIYTLQTKPWVKAFNKVIAIWEVIGNKPEYLTDEAFQSGAWRGHTQEAKNIVAGNLDISEDSFDIIFLAEFGVMNTNTKDVLYHIRVYNNRAHNGFVACVVDSDSGEVYSDFNGKTKQEVIEEACDEYPFYDQVTDTTE